MESVPRRSPQRGEYHKAAGAVTGKGSGVFLRAALDYAAKGIPVFPLVPGDKTPLIKKWPSAATTNPRRIKSWWGRWPNANVGIPTGKRSGILTLDVDPRAGGNESLYGLAADGHELPLTKVVVTGGDGRHLWLAYPDGEEIRNSQGKVGPGIDVRGEGGYVVAPPSRTTGPYEVFHERPLAKPPAWLLEAVRRPSEPVRGDVGGAGTVTPIGVNVAVEGPEIPHGERNGTLYRIACSLRGRGHDESSIREQISRVNDARCSTPLAAEEVLKIAFSAARHEPGKKAAPEVTPEVLSALDGLEEEVMRSDWPGVGGKSERDVMIALIRLARTHGEIIPVGVRVGVDVRTLALAAAVSKRSLLDNNRGGERRPGTISRLKMAGLLRSDNGMRASKEAGAFVLLVQPAQRCTTPTTFVLPSVSKGPGVACGAQLRAPGDGHEDEPELTDHPASPTAPRLRWSRPVFDGLTRVGTISRLGKSKGEIIDHLESAGGTLTVAELADELGVGRVRDLRRRHLEPLEGNGMVECSGDVVTLTPDWLDALNERREQDGEIADHRRDMARYEREREAYRNREKTTPGTAEAPAPAPGEVRERRETFPHRRRRALERSIADLFAARPEYRSRRVGQVTCALRHFLPDDFPRGGPDWYPKDHEVEAILDGEVAA